MCARVNRETHVSGLGIRLLLWVYRHCGQRSCRVLVAAIIACAYPFLRRARYASRVFRRQWSQYTGKRANSGFAHLRTFAYTLADRLACRAGMFDMNRVRVCTPAAYEELTNLYRKGRGVFCVTSHLGCFDMLRVLFDCTRGDMPGEIHVFMDTTATQAFARQQLRYGGQDLETYVHAVQDLGPALSMQMAEKVEQGAMVVMAGDRTWREGERANYSAPFLGRIANFPRGCFRWAASLGCPVYSFCLAENGGMYDLHVECLSPEGEMKAEPLANHFSQILQNLCCLYPLNWFNFYNFWK